MATVTLRPNAAGNQMGWDAEGGDYTRVDESSSDGDTTRLYTPTDNRVATFNIDNPSVYGVISQIEVFINTRGLDPINNTVQLAIRVNGTDYFSSDQTYNNTSYHTESNVWTTNPDTTNAWNWQDIKDLEIGMKRISGGGQAVTQVYVVVTYTAATVEQEGFRFRDDDGSESAASWLASQDTNITRAHSTNTRLRLLANITDDLGVDVFTLQYKEKTSGSWADVTSSAIVYGSELTEGGTASASHENTPSEGAAQGFDNSSSTKWLAFNTTPWLQYQFGSSATHIVNRYDMTSGNDDDTRDPKNWTLQGSNNGSDWDDLDTRTGETFASRGLTKSYTFSNSTAYEYYRLNVTANNGNGSITQLAELSLYAGVSPEIYYTGSSNITASGENTTSQLAAPSGKTTGDFDAGRIQDDENPTDQITISADDYTELEWNLQASSDADGNTYQFRLLVNGTVIDTYTVTPEWQVGSGTAHTKTLTETVTLSMSVVKIGSKSFLEPISLVDSTEKISSRTLLETVTLVEDFIGSKLAIKDLEETVTLVDLLERTTTKVLSETVTLVSSISNTINRTFSDVVTLVASSLQIPGRTFTEAINLDEVFETLHTHGRTFTETITLTDTLIRTISHVLSDALTLVSTLLSTPARLLSENITVVDSISKLPTKVLSEVISLVETFNRIMQRTLSETATLVDTIDTTQTATLTEVITVVDTITKSITRNLTESISLVEVVVTITGKVYTETITLVETFTGTINHIYTETITLTESNVYKFWSKITSTLEYISAISGINPGGWFGKQNEPYGVASSEDKPTGGTMNEDKPTGMAFAEDKPDGV